MADYRKRLSDMTPEEKQEQGISPAASNYGSLFGDRTKKPLSVDVAELGVEATPVGTAYGIADVYDELRKDNPDYTKVGLMAASELVGAVPYVGEVGQTMIRKGADALKGTDTVIDATSRIPQVPNKQRAIDKTKQGLSAQEYFKQTSNINFDNFDFNDLNLKPNEIEKFAKVNLDDAAVKKEEERIQRVIEARIPLITRALSEMLDTKNKSVVSLQDYKDAVYMTVTSDTVNSAAKGLANQQGLLNKLGPSMANDMRISDRVDSIAEDIDNPLLQELLTSGRDRDLVEWAVKENAIRKSYDKYIAGKGLKPQMANEDYDSLFLALDEVDNPTDWQKGAKALIKKGRVADPSIKTPELEDSTRLLLEGKITREEHLANVDKYKPVNAWDALPREPSDKALVFALDANKRRDGLFVLDDATAEALGVPQSSLDIGMRFNGRLDIPAYTNNDTWIVAGTSPAVKTADGKGVTTYAKAIHYVSEGDKPVKFLASEKMSAKIGTGEENKTGYATVSGIIGDLDADAIRAKAAEYLNDPEWTQVGFDPRRQGGFYVRAGENKHVPVREASEVIQIGPLVLARNAKLDFEYSGYNKGGMAMDEQMKAIFKSSRGYADGGMTESPRPKMRPELNLSYDDLKKIERVVWGEARDQGVEGRNAIRGVILNRLMSKRFPNTVDEVLSAKEFEPVRKYKGINNIPVDDETLDLQMQEMADYIQMGEDASKGSTFFLNKPLAKKRGTDFEGPNGFTINDHTFYGGYEGQEPVTDVNFSHDVRVGMAEGGLMEEDIDPVSGNEVPPGSLPEEVRDDIPAQLSEGEYVVPADVVRYYGVKFFEDLRSQAKQGWSEMEANGRIGGEPMTPEGMEMGGDELPFDISELQVIDDDMPQPMNTGGIVRGFADGGLGIDTKIDYSGALKTTPTPDNPFSPSASQGGYKIIEYTDDAGNVLYIQFLNGRPMSYIPEGFRPKGSEVQATTTAAPVEEKQVVEQDAETWKTGPKLSSAEMDRLLNTSKDYTSADLKTISEDVKNLDKTFAPVGLLGTAIGLAQQNENRKRAYDMIDGISYQLESLDPNDKANEQIIKDLTDQKNKIQSFLNPQPKEGLMASVAKGTGIYGGKTSMYEGLSDVSDDNKVTFADTWLGDLIGADGTIGIDAKDAEGNKLGLSESLAGGRRQGEDPYETSEKDMASMRERSSRSSEDTRSKSQKARDAVSTYQAASNSVEAARASGDDAAFHEAIRAQSEASRQSTKAVQEASGSTGFFDRGTNPNWRDEA